MSDETEKPGVIYKLTGLTADQLKTIFKQDVSTPLEKLLAQALLRVNKELEKKDDKP